MVDAAPSASRPPLPASVRSPVAVAATAALTVAVALLQPDVATALLRAALVPVLVAAALVDLDRRLIPNRLTGPAALLALVLGLVLAPGTELTRAAWAAGAGGFLLLAALASPAGMGMGDVKLVAVIGLFLGPPVALALFVALGATALVGIGLIARRGLRAGRRATLPLAPFLAAGGILAAVLAGVAGHPPGL